MKTLPLYALALAATAFLTHLPLAALGNDRFALVIGNSAYEHSRPLDNPKNDALALSARLQAAGFEAPPLLDLTHRQMEEKLKEFGAKLKPTSTALLFFAGHGMQVGGVTYLMPVDASADDETSIKYEAVSLEQVLDVMDQNGAGAGLKIVILDSCRDNPFGRGWRGSRSNASTGLAAPSATPQGTILAFATDPGNVAADGLGSNSPYTTSLLEHLFTPGVEVDAAFRRVGANVQKLTSKKQNPWRNSNFNGEFSFIPGDAPPPAAATATTPFADAAAVNPQEQVQAPAPPPAAAAQAQSATPGNWQVDLPPVSNTGTTGTSSAAPAMTNMTQFNHRAGLLSFSYPAHWSALSPPTALGITFTAADMATGMSVSVFEIPQTTDVDEALALVYEAFSSYGLQVVINQSGVAEGVTVLIGTTQDPTNGPFTWVGMFKPVTGGVIGLTMGTPSANFQASQATIMQYLSTVRIP